MSRSVVCVSVSAALGGSERVLLDFATRARGHGFEPLVLVPREGPLLDALRESAIDCGVAAAPAQLLATGRNIGMKELAALPGGLRSWSAALRAAMRIHGVASPGDAILYSNGFKAHLACALVGGHARVWHLHEFPPAGAGALWRLAAGMPAALVANSKAVARAWRLPLLPAPETVLNGVDIGRFAPAPRTGWIHEQLALEPVARLIGMPAAFARWKGQIEVIAAFERLAPAVPAAHLVLAGGAIYDTDTERGYAHEMVARVGRSSFAGRIHFLKFQNEPWRLYPEFDVTVHYSQRAEPFGRVIVESMACGVPVIAARAGGPLEIVEDGVSGWLVPPGEVQALADRLALVLGSEDLPAAGRAARARAESRFSADRFAAEVAGVLARAGARGGS
jgi:glycosyltransferase involved in cell wall biosynthesis